MHTDRWPINYQIVFWLVKGYTRVCASQVGRIITAKLFVGGSHGVRSFNAVAEMEVGVVAGGKPTEERYFCLSIV